MSIDPSEVIQDQEGGIPSDEVKVDKPLQGQDIPNDEVKLDTPEGGIPANEVVPDPMHASPMQQGIAALEGISKGATFGLSTKAETMAGVDPKDIIARQKENPLIAIGSEAAGTIGSMFVPGVGEGWLLSKVGKLAFPIAEEASALAKTGRLALRGIIDTAGMASGDELSDAFLDKGHDATGVVGHIVGAGALGLLTGGALGTGQAGLKAIQNQAYGKYLDDFAIGLGKASNGGTLEDLKEIHKMVDATVPKGMEHGMKFFEEYSKKLAAGITDAATRAVGGAAGLLFGGPLGSTVGYDVAKKWFSPISEKLVSKVAPQVTSKVLTPIMLQALKLGEYSGITHALDYGVKASKGAQTIEKGLDSLFKVGGSKPLEFDINEKDNEKLNKYIEDGGIDQQMDEFQDSPPDAYAKGGIVKAKPFNSDGVSRLYPAQHMMLTSSKTRVSNYLNSIRPQAQIAKPIFDQEYKDPVKEHSYKSALHIANKPLSILKHIQDGSLDMDKMKHFTGMYPDVHEHLSKKITERLIKHQSEETRPSYAIRQGLSLFLGSNLDSSTSPQSIIAAQSTFTPRQSPQQQQAEKKTKKGTAPLSKVSKDYKTTTQEAESDRSARD